MSKASVEKVTAEDVNHNGDVNALVLFDGHLYSAGYDGKVKIWDLDLNLIKELTVHDANIFTIAVDKKGGVYTTSVDGSIKFVEKPLESEENSVILEHENEIEAIFVDDSERFFCGDDQGDISCFENGKQLFKRNIDDPIKMLYVENNFIYSMLNNDMSIHEIKEGGKLSMKTSVPGKYPLSVFGSKYIAVATRDCKGVQVMKNSVEERFAKIVTKQNVHGMTINAMNGFGDYLFSCDFLGELIRSQVIGNELKELARTDTESGCGNCIVAVSETVIYIGNTDGTIKKIVFEN